MRHVAFAMAYGAGLLAALNPCGFALLPAFLSMNAASGPERGRTRAAVATGTAVATGFAAVFGVAGVVVSVGMRSLTRVAPSAALVVGIALVAMGVASAAGRGVTLRVPLRHAASGGPAPLAALAFGAAYGVGSISCELPVFFVVVAGSTAQSSVAGSVVVWCAYALGAWTLLVLVALLGAHAGDLLVRRVRRAAPALSRVPGAMLVLGGTYLVYTWAAALTGRDGAAFLSPLQRQVRDAVRAVPVSLWLLLAVVVLAAAVFSPRTRRGFVARRTPEPPTSRRTPEPVTER